MAYYLTSGVQFKVGGLFLFFLGQNQFDAFPHNLCSCLAVLFAVFLDSPVRFCVDTGLYFNLLWIV